MIGWLTQAGPYRVEHYPFSYLSGDVDWSQPPKGVLHTTEGPTIEGALAVFSHPQTRYAPVFTCGPDHSGRRRILQHCPLGVQGWALEHTSYPPTNQWARVQIEFAHVSSPHQWTPAPPDIDMLGWLFAELSLPSTAGIPLKHFVNPQRSGTVWQRSRGWCGHVDVPENHHVDPQAMNWPVVMAAATTRQTQLRKAGSPTGAILAKPRAADRVTTLGLRVRAKLA